VFDHEVRLRGTYSDERKRNTMVCHDFSDRDLHRCRRAVYGPWRGFRLLGQGVGQHGRRRRMHRRCIGCEENTRQGPSPQTRPQTISGRRINKAKDPHFLVRPGSHFPVPAVRISTARRARPTQAWPLLQRPPAGLGLDRPSTVLRLQEAVAIIGTVRSNILVSCGSDRRPSGPRPAPSGQAGLGRAANARRAIERGPRPFGEEPPRARLISNRPCSVDGNTLGASTPTNHVGSHLARRHQGQALRVGLRPSLDRSCAQRSFDTARSGRRNGLQLEQRNWMEAGSPTRAARYIRGGCTNTAQNYTEVPAFARFSPLQGLPVRAKILSVLNAQDLTAIGTNCDVALSDHPAA